MRTLCFRMRHARWQRSSWSFASFERIRTRNVALGNDSSTTPMSSMTALLIFRQAQYRKRILGNERENRYKPANPTDAKKPRQGVSSGYLRVLLNLCCKKQKMFY